MKLKSFNPDNTRTVRKGAMTMSFNTSTGIIMINKPTIEHIGLKMGDMIEFHQDEEDVENWYLEKVASGGFTLRGKEGGGLFMNSVAMVRRLFESIECEKKSGTALIAGEATVIGKRKLYGIITGRIKNDA